MERARFCVAATVASLLIGTACIADDAPAVGVPAVRPGSVPAARSQPGFEGLHVMRGTPAYADTALGRLHYWTLGTGPTVVLLHQGPLFGVEYAYAQPLLAARGFRAIALDIPGFGFSTRPDHPASGDEYADAIAALLDALGVRTAAVVGNHTGSTVALAFASRHPERTTCAVLQSLPVYSREELQERLVQAPLDTTIWSDGRQIPGWYVRTGKYGDRMSPELLQWMFVGSALSGDSDWYGESTGRTFVTRAFDAGAALRTLTIPTLLVDSGDTLAASMQRARELRPDLEHVAVDPAHRGTVVAYDAPDYYVGLIGGFLDARCRTPRG
jgi:pimeloyl-ACP methyl ester carboxylesterase